MPIIDKYTQQIKDMIYHSTDKEVIENLKRLKDNMPLKEIDYYMTQSIADYIKYFDEDELEDIYEDDLIRIMKQAYELYDLSRKSITIRVTLAGLAAQFYREMEIPYDITLADLVYFVLSTFHADGSHLYSVTFEKEHFLCLNEFHEEMKASNVYISQLWLTRNSHIDIVYDLGDSWLFRATVKSINEHDCRFTIDQSRIIKGKGYGIWEDEQEMMNMYYKHHDDFLDSDINEDDFIIKEFDIAEANDTLLSGYYDMKSIYSKY